MPIFYHNAVDILSTACLAGIVPFAFHEPGAAPIRHGADFIGLILFHNSIQYRRESGTSRTRSVTQ